MRECHQIESSDSVAYNAKKAWHGLGTIVPEGELTLESLQVHAPRFLFDIESRPLILGQTEEGLNESGEIASWTKPTDVVLPDHNAQIATDDNTVLSVTSDKYHTFSNRELFEVVQKVSAFGKETKLESVMTLKGRRIAVILAQAGQFVLPGDDEVKKYFLFTTSHDGTMAFHAKATSIRVVCRNTLNMSVNGNNDAGFTIRHTASMEDKIIDGMRALQMAEQHFDVFEDQTRTLAAHEMGRKDIEAFFLNVYQKVNGVIPFNPQTRGEKTRHTRALDTLTRWTQLLDDPKQRMAGNVTAWSALNAITEQIDHEGRVRRSRGESKEEAANFSKLFGSAAKAKHTALKEALALV